MLILGPKIPYLPHFGHNKTRTQKNQKKAISQIWKVFYFGAKIGPFPPFWASKIFPKNSKSSLLLLLKCLSSPTISEKVKKRDLH